MTYLTRMMPPLGRRRRLLEVWDANNLSLHIVGVPCYSQSVHLQSAEHSPSLLDTSCCDRLMLRESRATRVEVARPPHGGCRDFYKFCCRKVQPSQVSHLQHESCETFTAAHVFYGVAFSIPNLIDFTSEIVCRNFETSIKLLC